MDEPSLQSLIEAAEAYEALFVKALFAEWAPRVADAVGVEKGERALDVGSGTGVLAREIASRVGPEGRVVGLDPNPGMLAVAQRLTPTAEWREGTAESLPFPDESFDAAVSQFSLMFFKDRRRAVGEMLRVLRPGGRMAVAVWDGLDNNPGYDRLVAVLDRVAGQPAGDGLRAPFVLGDRDSLSTLFDEVGVTGADVSTHAGTARFPSLRSMVEAEVRGWLPVVGVVLPEDVVGEIHTEAEKDLGPYITPEETVEFPTSAHIVTVRKG